MRAYAEFSKAKLSVLNLAATSPFLVLTKIQVLQEKDK